MAYEMLQNILDQDERVYTLYIDNDEKQVEYRKLFVCFCCFCCLI